MGTPTPTPIPTAIRTNGTSKPAPTQSPTIVTSSGPDVISVKLNKKKLTLKLRGKKKIKLYQKVESKQGKGYSYKWKSSKKKIATVSLRGLVKAKKKGKTKITFTAWGVDGSRETAKCIVKVKR